MASLSAAIEEERKEILKLLESSESSKSQRSTSVGRTSTPSPYTTARPPIRSMLDITEDPPSRNPRQGSLPSSSIRSTQGPVRSMLDVNGPPSAPLIRSTKTPPPKATDSGNASRIRSLSDAAPRPPGFGQINRPDPTVDYQFSGILPSNPGGPKVRKRNTLAGKIGLGSMVSNKSNATGSDLGKYGSSRDRESKSPYSRFSGRAQSPAPSMHNIGPAGKFNQSTTVLPLDDGTMIDMNSAYRRLSDANLALSGGSLASLSRSARGASGGKRSSSNPRLEKDYTYHGGQGAVESSDEEPFSSEEEGVRGRRKGESEEEELGESDPEAKTLGMGKAKGPRKTLSLMAAAEEERRSVVHKQKVRSLLDPEIRVTGPTGKASKYIHPSTSFDQGGPSGISTPISSETEADIKDIKRAQKLEIKLTPIMSYTESHRCVRTIYRGDFAEMQQEAQDDHRRVRKYLIATDLSDEAAHAMEWTIGTVLRDGDTLLAIYCVDEETGIGVTTDNSASQSGAEETAIKEQAAVVAATANRPPMANAVTTGGVPSRLGFSDYKNSSLSPSPWGRLKSKAEQERHHAVQDITDRVKNLLRKTRLQVRVVIEVIHCKSPKHLITEVIDFIDPTMVILGSRGRSALKGVILGSFSNYLVTKSSVPVMVARKKLRKHNKFKPGLPSQAFSKLTNNLTNVSGRSLAAAKID